MATTVRLTNEKKDEASKLYDEYYPTIEATAAQAKSSWCSAIEFDDLIQEGFEVLLSCAGMLGTPGKYDPNRQAEGGKKPAAFRTYLITSLRNKYRDMGASQGALARRIHFVDEYVESPTEPKREEDEFESLKLGKFWEKLSPVERVIFDIRYCSYPEKVPLTGIAQLLQLPYDRILLANTSLKSKLESSQYNHALNRSGQDCFGLYPDESCAECVSCVDLDACKGLHAKSDGSKKTGGSQMWSDDAGGSATTTAPAENAENAAPATAPAPAAAPANPKRTMMDVAFERLARGPASKDELVAAIQAEMPGNKGTRAFDLMSILKSRSLITELAAVDEQQVQGDGTSKTVKVKRIQLNEGALDQLVASEELKVITEQKDGQDVVRYHLKLKQ